MLLFSMSIEITSFVRGRTGVRLHSIVPDGSSAKYTCTERLEKKYRIFENPVWKLR